MCTILSCCSEYHALFPPFSDSSVPFSYGEEGPGVEFWLSGLLAAAALAAPSPALVTVGGGVEPSILEGKFRAIPAEAAATNQF